jgi:hypothetical protein
MFRGHVAAPRLEHCLAFLLSIRPRIFYSMPRLRPAPKGRMLALMDPDQARTCWQSERHGSAKPA